MRRAHPAEPCVKSHQLCLCSQAAQQAALDAIQGQQEAANAAASAQEAQAGTGVGRGPLTPRKRVRMDAYKLDLCVTWVYRTFRLLKQHSSCSQRWLQGLCRFLKPHRGTVKDVHCLRL